MIHTPDLAALRRIALLADLPDAALHRVAAVVMARTYASNELLLLQGEPDSTAYFIAAGSVRIYRVAPNGREQVLARLGPGQSFNTVPPFTPTSHTHANVQTLSETTLYAIHSDDLTRLVQTCPEFALALLRDFATRLTHFTDLVEDLSLRTVRGRLARFLLDQAEGETLTQRWTQDEMAAQLGSVRDVIGRTLRALSDAGLIRIERNRLLLLDRDALEAETWQG